MFLGWLMVIKIVIFIKDPKVLVEACLVLETPNASK